MAPAEPPAPDAPRLEPDTAQPEIDFARRFEPAAREALSAWPIEVASLNLVSHSENVAYRVDATDGGRYTFRLHRPTYHTFAELESEQHFTAHLAASGLSVPEVVRTVDGGGYTRVEVTPGEHRYAGLLKWVDGEVMRARFDAMAEDEIADAYASLGALMARMHDAALAWQPPAGFTRPILDADGLMGPQPFWGPFWDHPEFRKHEVDRLIAVRDQIHAKLLALPRQGVFSLIHADLHPGNVVIADSAAHIIDFDDTAFGWHAFDFAVAVPGGWHREGPDYRGKALIEGYRRVRACSDETFALASFFSFVRHLQHIGWIRHRPELKQPDWRAMAERTMALIDHWEGVF